LARVLFINGGSEGHVNPTIGVVQELISRGEEVVYFSIEDFENVLKRREPMYEHLTAKNF